MPRFNPSKTMNMILSGKISHSQIEKGSQYEESVKPRLEALIRLKETLEQDFQLHSYMPQFYSFTQTKRDYRENQRPRSILKKERVHIATNTTKVLFDRLNR